MERRVSQKPLKKLNDVNKILYLGTSQFSEMMNVERWQLTKGMIESGDYIFFDLKKRQEINVDLYKVWIDSGSPNFIIVEDYDWAHKLDLPLKYINAEKIPVPIWGFIADYWYDPKEKLEYFTNNRISGLIAIHEAANQYVKENFSRQISEVVNIPFSIDRNEFSDKPLEKEYDVLCSGFMGDLYPLRQRIRDILKKNSRINTHFLEHPGYWKKNEKIGLRGADYYAIMEKAKFVISTTGIYNISPRKHIEIVASRAKILGNTTGFSEHEIFENFILRLDLTMTDEKIVKLIEEGISAWKWSDSDETKRKIVLDMHDPVLIAKSLKEKLAQSHNHD
jgi:hypothetical protein